MGTDAVGFLPWARETAVPIPRAASVMNRQDLAPLGAMIADARFVALSEPVHGAAEPLEFRNQLLQYLVYEKGFTAIALESGLLESRSVYDYVRGGPGSVASVAARGVSWTFDRLPQNHALIAWLREYNSDPRHERKVNFYGFDIPGSPGIGQVNRGIDTALAAALEYLGRVDIAQAGVFHAQLGPLWKELRFDLRRSLDEPGYDRLSESERGTLTAVIADLINWLERREAQYIAVSSVSDYEWGYRAAINARQVDGWLRQIPPLWQPSTDPIELPSERFRFLAAANDVRDRAQADNLDWVAEQEGPSGKVLIFAHRYHLSTTPVTAPWSVTRGAELCPQQVLGTYLRRRWDGGFLTIGSLVGEDRAGTDSVEALLRRVGEPRFLLDLRRAPAEMKGYLDTARQLGAGADALGLPVGKAFDVLLYLDAVTPAVAA